MKKICLCIIISIIIITGINSIYSQNAKEAYDYLVNMDNKYSHIQKAMWDYIRVSAHSKMIFVSENKRKSLIKQIKTAINEVNKMPSFYNDSSYKDSVISYLNSIYAIFTEDYGKLVNMEEIAEQSYDLMEAYIMAKSKAEEKSQELAENLNSKVLEYAKKYNINMTFTEDEISKNLKIAGKVYDYYNIIYLIFFKSQIQEHNLIQAMNKQNINEIEQIRTNLIKNSNEGLTNLKSLQSYNNDNSIINTCEKILLFYKKESEEKFAKVSDYYLQRDLFDKIAKAFTQKNDSDKTQADYDQYNKKVEEINKAVFDYNNTNKELDEERNKLIQLWNNAINTFMDKHIPK